MYDTDYVYTKEEKRLYCESCKRFLPDRYVLGECPNCGSACKGDACEKCGKIFEPEELINPLCGICSAAPIFKDNFQYYIKLSKLEKALKNYFELKKENWNVNAINLTERYFSEGLIDRAISRDLDWGVAIPINIKEKVIYNWAENVLGYIDACKEYCEINNLNFYEWFRNKNTKHYYVHAKDNIQFHTIIYPALLLENGNKYNLPDYVLSYEFVTNNGQKISKSKGTYLSVRELLNKYDVDFLRYYFAKNVSDKKDLDFKESELINAANGELINNWANLVNRTLSFIKNKFNGVVEKNSVEEDIKTKIKNTYESVGKFIEKGKISNALKEILELVDFANKYFNNTEPWNVLKQDESKCKNLCYQYLTIIANIAILINPFTPKGSEKVLSWLNINNISYSFKLLENTQINLFEQLYKKIEINN